MSAHRKLGKYSSPQLRLSPMQMALLSQPSFRQLQTLTGGVATTTFTVDAVAGGEPEPILAPGPVNSPEGGDILVVPITTIVNPDGSSFTALLEKVTDATGGISTMTVTVNDVGGGPPEPTQSPPMTNSILPSPVNLPQGGDTLVVPLTTVTNADGSVFTALLEPITDATGGVSTLTVVVITAGGGEPDPTPLGPLPLITTMSNAGDGILTSPSMGRVGVVEVEVVPPPPPPPPGTENGGDKGTPDDNPDGSDEDQDNDHDETTTAREATGPADPDNNSLIFTITFVTDLIFDSPSFEVDTAAAYSAMSSIDFEQLSFYPGGILTVAATETFLVPEGPLTIPILASESTATEASLTPAAPTTPVAADPDVPPPPCRLSLDCPQSACNADQTPICAPGGKCLCGSSSLNLGPIGRRSSPSYMPRFKRGR
ncbi:hypothetical protein IFR05_004871 [Cadophora sp. M221]|nr:hypothetical protein IFR05_004871 [Cadophora sp. M221]